MRADKPTIKGDIIFEEQADHASTPAASYGYLWVKNDTPNALMFTDDAGTDYAITPPASGGGASPEDADIWLDAGGAGDYTDINTAFGALTAGQTMFISSGSYTLTADILLTVSNVRIVGANNKGVQINLDQYDIRESGGVADNWIWENVGFTTTSTSLGGYIQIQDYWQFNNCYFTINQGSTSDQPIRFTGFSSMINGGVVYQNVGSNTAEEVIQLGGTSNTVANATLVGYNTGGSAGGLINITSGSRYARVINNTFLDHPSSLAIYAVVVFGDNSIISNNTFYDSRSDMRPINLASVCSDTTVSNNTIYARYRGIQAENSTQRITVTGNVVIMTASEECISLPATLQSTIKNNICKDGNKSIAVVNSEDTVVEGNICNSPSSYAIDISSSRRDVVKNNRCIDVGGAQAIYHASSTMLTKYDNFEDDKPSENVKTDFYMNNTGSAISRGAVVVLDYATSGTDVAPTTTASDPKVLGVVDSNSTTVANLAYAPVITRGLTRYLKVDGTTAIAIGDYLTTSTTSEVAVKASSGQIAFAIAREAYSTADANGVIDAIVIPPITVP